MKDYYCSYAKCKREAEVILEVSDRRVKLCRRHYRKVIRQAERRSRRDSDLTLNDLLKIKYRRVYLRG